jgi:hypothetical protein
MKQVKAYLTEDGKIHATEADAKRHEVTLSQHNVIDDFLSSESNPYTAMPQRTIARQSIINWELWKNHAK